MINRKLVLKAARVIGSAVLSAQTLLGGLVSSTPSIKKYASGEEKLVVYKNVPGHHMIINKHPLNKKLSFIKGTKQAPYTGKVMLKNITVQDGLDGSKPVRLTQSNYKNYFETNEFVDKSIFE